MAQSGEVAGSRVRLAAPLITIALTALLLTSIIGLGALLIWQNYRSALAMGEARALSSAHVVAAHMQWMIEASDQALRRIDTALGPDLQGRSPEASAGIVDALVELPASFHYSVYDQSGNLRHSSMEAAEEINVADRDYFRRLSEGAQVVISPQFRERLSGRNVFAIARRITRQGSFGGVATIVVPSATIAEFWSLMELGPHSSVAVIRADGWLVARYPEVENTIDLSGTPIFTNRLSASPGGFYHSAVSPADGLARIVGYREIEGWPLVATTGVERGEALRLFHASLRWWLLLGLPILGLLVTGAIWIARLLKAEETRRAQLEKALEHNRFLFREIHHRVKNNLQAVSSLIRLQPLPAEAREDMARRIAAMVAVHEQIYRSDQFDRVDMAPYAEKLVRDIAAGYDSDVEIETRLEPLSVPRDQALPLGLILNEAVSNAFKHAFSLGKGGRLTVELKETGGDGRLLVKDDGPGFVPQEGKQHGMGSRLIAGFVSQIGGSVTVESREGTVVSVSFPLG